LALPHQRRRSLQRAPCTYFLVRSNQLFNQHVISDRSLTQNTYHTFRTPARAQRTKNTRATTPASVVRPAASKIAAAPRATSDPLYPKQEPRPIDEMANLTVAPTGGSGRSRRTGTLGAAGAAAISQATTHTVGGTQPIIRPKKKRVGAYEFEDSEEEDHNEFVEPNDNVIENAEEGVTEEPGNKDDKPKTRRVTILPPVPETEEEADRVQYPKLRDFSDHEDLSQVYPVFHPWLLHPYDDHPLVGQRQEPQGPVDVDEEGDLYEVEDILDSKVDRRRKDTQTGKKGVLRYLIKWTGWDTTVVTVYRCSHRAPCLPLDVRLAYDYATSRLPSDMRQKVMSYQAPVNLPVVV
jgi:hypothetical protein